ncbi:hypothetical protein BDFB_010101 [Asbolus verrucosus]|uniref:Uncharacterized protein n=1 Tax=Asbolus verrucosus TaxID=1661398 RepID=A0A482WB95_ASBVE|nr:hypothetical protein BDFB_010101 [Asbolus verrucosus]
MQRIKINPNAAIGLKLNSGATERSPVSESSLIPFCRLTNPITLPVTRSIASGRYSTRYPQTQSIRYYGISGLCHSILNKLFSQHLKVNTPHQITHSPL